MYLFSSLTNYAQVAKHRGFQRGVFILVETFYSSENI